MFQGQGQRRTAADVGWVLRTARLHADDPEMRVGARMASGLGRVPAVNPSQVTRWELGSTPVTSQVVRRYETLCGVPPGHLVAAVDLIHRDATPRGTTPGLRRPPSDDVVGRAQPILERVLEDGDMTSEDWDDLSLLIGREEQLLMPHRLWRALVERGLDELAVSTGAPYLRRAEAMARVVGHPRAAAAVHGLVRDVLAVPDAPVFVEATGLLIHADVPDVGELLCKAMATAESPDARRACLSALAGLLRARRLDGETAVDVASTALEVCRDRTEPYRVRRAAADVLRTLTADARRRIAGHLARHPDHVTTASILRGRSPIPVPMLLGVRLRILQLHRRASGVDVEDDGRLAGLLDTLLTESHDRRRADVGRLLALLPFGPAVGRALVEELRSAVHDTNPTHVHEMLGAVAHVAPGGDLRLLVDLAVRDVEVGTGDEVAVEACHAIGSVTCSPGQATAIGARVQRALTDAGIGGRPASTSLVDAWARAVPHAATQTASGGRRARSPGASRPPVDRHPPACQRFAHERCRDSAAGLEHVANIGPTLEPPSDVCTVNGEICGTPSREL